MMADKQSGIKPSNLGELTRTGGPGRPMGSKNRVPANLRNDLITVYEQLGGIEGMRDWAKKNDRNRTVFYKILASTLPRQVAVSAKVDNYHGLEKLSDEELIVIIKNGEALVGEIIDETKLIEKEGSSK
jgi:hypothetical protein